MKAWLRFVKATAFWVLFLMGGAAVLFGGATVVAYLWKWNWLLAGLSGAIIWTLGAATLIYVIYRRWPGEFEEVWGK